MHQKRSQTAFYYIFQSITVQFSTVSILHPAHRGTPTDWNEIQKVERYIRVPSSILSMEREKENPSQLNRIFTCGHTRIHHIYCTSLQKKKRKVKVSHNLNKSASVYSEMAFRCSAFQFKTKKIKLYKSFSMDSMWGHFCSIESEDWKERIDFSLWLLDFFFYLKWHQ